MSKRGVDTVKEKKKKKKEKKHILLAGEKGNSPCHPLFAGKRGGFGRGEQKRFSFHPKETTFTLLVQQKWGGNGKEREVPRGFHVEITKGKPVVPTYNGAGERRAPGSSTNT